MSPTLKITVQEKKIFVGLFSIPGGVSVSVILRLKVYGSGK